MHITNLEEAAYFSLLEDVVPMSAISLKDVTNIKEAVALFKSSSDFEESGISDKNEGGLWNYIMYEDKPAGLIVVTIVDQKRRRICEINSVVIKEEYRGKGLLRGELLLFDKYKVDMLIAEVKDYNTQSAKAHKKLGFKKHKPDVDWHDFVLRKKDLVPKGEDNA